MNNLVVYYSNTGNNKYLAEKIANDKKYDLYEISPRVKSSFGLILSSLLKISFGINNITKSIKDYDAVILCGPIWMGQLISPLKDFLKKYKDDINKLYFITCCGGGEDDKDTKFGYTKIFEKIQILMAEKLDIAEAISIELITPEEMKGKGEETMKLRLSDENFKGEILKRYNSILNKIE
jgi:flavodoxin